MKCPTCGCEAFYVKDADDEYDIYEFTCSGGQIEFSDTIDTEDTPQIQDETETFCNRCAWHGQFGTFK